MLSAEDGSQLFTEDNTNSFSMTGIVLLRELRKTLFTVPAIIFTNTGNKTIIDRVSTHLEELQHAVVMWKSEFADPFEFCNRVSKILQVGIEVERRRKVHSRFLDSIMLEPNFAGIGFDIRKLFGAIKHRPKKGTTPNTYKAL